MSTDPWRGHDDYWETVSALRVTASPQDVAADEQRSRDAGPVVLSYSPPQSMTPSPRDVTSVTLFADGTNRTGYVDGTWHWETHLRGADDD